MVLVLLPKIRGGSSGPRGAEETTLENLGWFCSNSAAMFCTARGQLQLHLLQKAVWSGVQTSPALVVVRSAEGTYTPAQHQLSS